MADFKSHTFGGVCACRAITIAVNGNTNRELSSARPACLGQVVIDLKLDLVSGRKVSQSLNSLALTHTLSNRHVAFSLFQCLCVCADSHAASAGRMNRLVRTDCTPPRFLCESKTIAQRVTANRTMNQLCISFTHAVNYFLNIQISPTLTSSLSILPFNLSIHCSAIRKNDYAGLRESLKRGEGIYVTLYFWADSSTDTAEDGVLSSFNLQGKERRLFAQTSI